MSNPCRSYCTFSILDLFVLKGIRSSVSSSPTRGSEIHTSLEHHRMTQTAELSRCSELCLYEVTAPAPRSSLVDRRERESGESEAASGFCRPSSPATAPRPSTELSAGVCPRNTPAPGKREQIWVLKQRTGRKRPQTTPGHRRCLRPLPGC